MIMLTRAAALCAAIWLVGTGITATGTHIARHSKNTAQKRAGRNIAISIETGLQASPKMPGTRRFTARFQPVSKRNAYIGEMLELFTETRVTATLTVAAQLKRTRDGGVVMQLAAGQTVEILRDYGEQWYFVRELLTDKRGWLPGDVLRIPPDTPAETAQLRRDELEDYVNAMGYASQTAYLALVDLGRQRTYVFKGSKHKWQLVKSLECSTGKNASPTIRGTFKLLERGLWFYSERLGSGGKFWVRIDGPYLFHSLPMDRNGNVQDYTLGQRVSSGCVRFSIADADWFYKTVPEQSCVIIL